MHLYKFTSYNNIYVFVYINKQYIVDLTLLDAIISINKYYKSLKICTRTKFFLDSKQDLFLQDIRDTNILNISI